LMTEDSPYLVPDTAPLGPASSMIDDDSSFPLSASWNDLEFEDLANEGNATSCIPPDPGSPRVVPLVFSDTPQCVVMAVQASDIEAEAMKLDNSGRAADAIGRYRDAAAKLLEAADACPQGHPDRPVIEEHAAEVLARVAYLEALGGAPATEPLEVHIHGVQLTMGAEAPDTSLPDDVLLIPDVRRTPGSFSSTGGLVRKEAKVMGAAACIAGGAGLLLSGPVVGVAACAAAAYATTREDKAGSAARKVGSVGVCAVDKASSLAEQHRISHNVVAAGQSAVGQAKALDSRYRVSARARVATSQTQQAINEFNRDYRVTDRIKGGLLSAGSGLAGLAQRVTR